MISRRKEVPITTPIEETLVSHNKLKVIFMNINSLISPNKRIKATLGIQKSKADVVILAETKLNSHSQEFQVPGYYMAGQLTRKTGAGGMLVMAKKIIKIHSVTTKSILPEIQVIAFVFNGYTFITVYRSPSLSVKARIHHKNLPPDNFGFSKVPYGPAMLSAVNPPCKPPAGGLQIFEV